MNINFTSSAEEYLQNRLKNKNVTVKIIQSIDC